MLADTFGVLLADGNGCAVHLIARRFQSTSYA